MDHEITAAEAAAALTVRDAARASVTAASARYATWLVGLAAASSLYVFSLGFWPVSAVEPIIASTVAFGAWVAVLTIWLIPTTRVSPTGFTRQFGLAVGAWGAVFAFALAFGLAFELGPLFLWPMAGAVPIPLLVGAHLRLRGGARD